MEKLWSLVLDNLNLMYRLPDGQSSSLILNKNGFVLKDAQ